MAASSMLGHGYCVHGGRTGQHTIWLAETGDWTHGTDASTPFWSRLRPYSSCRRCTEMSTTYTPLFFLLGLAFKMLCFLFLYKVLGGLPDKDEGVLHLNVRSRARNYWVAIGSSGMIAIHPRNTPSCHSWWTMTTMVCRTWTTTEQ
jgi:hypothetical protein